MICTRILILDDDEILCSELVEYFREEGFNVECALNVDRAELLLTENSYDFFLIDYKMPKKNGVEFLLQVKSLLNNTKVFMMSGSLYVHELIEEYGLSPIVKNIFFKPFESEDILMHIKEKHFQEFEN